MKITPENIRYLAPHEIFVFGSNLAGIHGAGAARSARWYFRAKAGVGVGPSGSCYAIPTKDKLIKTLPLTEIATHVEDFLRYVRRNPSKQFLVTPIGCGLAGYEPAEIAPLFFAHGPIPENVSLPASFWRHGNEE